MSLTVHLPLPPSANALFKSLHGGRRARTTSYDRWSEEAGYHLRMAHREAGLPKFNAPWRLKIAAGAGRNRDISNTIKAIEDLIVKVIPGMPDDRWNDDLHVSRDPSLPAGTAIVTIESVAPG